jgi:hypothetical protein
LTVILERDGSYPPMSHIPMLYVDAGLRAKFLLSPHEEAARAGLSAEQCRALENVDRIGLEMAARSFTGSEGPARETSLGASARPSPDE